MAHNNVEIEIKIPLNSDDFDKVKILVEKKTKFVKTTKQSDTYYTPKHRDFLSVKYPFEWLSIRERGGKKILNYKHFYPENAEITTHCDEFETDVNENMENIFASLDFVKLVTVNKTRNTFVTDDFEIALDFVEDLGYFIEIETIKDFGTVELARNELFKFAEALGLNISKTDKRGYPYLLLKKEGLISSF